MQELETKAETDASLQVMASKTRINFLRLLSVIANYRIANIDAKNRSAIWIVFKHAADIYIQKRAFLRVRENKNVVVRRIG